MAAPPPSEVFTSTIFKKRSTRCARCSPPQKKVPTASRAHLAEYCQINPHTLKSACDSKKLTFSLDLESKLAKGGKFEITAPAWNDQCISPADKRVGRSNYRGRDTAIEFRKFIFLTWGIGTTHRLSLQGMRPNTLDADLASFSISDLGQNVSAEEPINAFLQLDIAPAYTDCGRYQYGFCLVNVRLNLPQGNDKKVSNRSAQSECSYLGGAELRARGNEFEPFWELRARSGILHGEYATREAPLCQLVNHQAGDKFEAVLYIRHTGEHLNKIDGEPLSSAAKKGR